MKKAVIFLNLLLLIICFSCSNDDNSTSAEPTDLIVGKWNLEGIESNGEYIQPNECEANSFWEFFQNGELTMLMYGISPQNGECEGELEDLSHWEKTGENLYMLTDSEEAEGGILEITFSDGNELMITSNASESIHFYMRRE
ncbi:MAG TPA: lipocalin family protein [Salinimicrobium sp.]|nr:lipocalin family protein [Salinimicrobium sp.]